MSNDGIESYKNTLGVEELRRQVRSAWASSHALTDALRDLPETPPPFVLLLLSRSAKWPHDWEKGNELQRKLGLDAIPPKTECELGAGLWFCIREGLLTSTK